MAKQQRTKQSTEKTEEQLKQEEQRKVQWEMHKKLLAAEPCNCSRCGCTFFQQVYQVKQVNVGEGDEKNMRHVPLHAWKCVTCDYLFNDPSGLTSKSTA